MLGPTSSTSTAALGDRSSLLSHDLVFSQIPGFVMCHSEAHRRHCDNFPEHDRARAQQTLSALICLAAGHYEDAQQLRPVQTRFRLNGFSSLGVPGDPW